jgi:hypothetical protein
MLALLIAWRRERGFANDSLLLLRKTALLPREHGDNGVRESLRKIPLPPQQEEVLITSEG